MKKILLIIAIVFCMFQMVVLATAIDIGNTATNESFEMASNGQVMIVQSNPANEDGKVTSVEIWASTNMSGVVVGTVFNVAGTNFTSRDYETIDNGAGAGVVTSGSLQTFTVDLEVEAGDYIAYFCSSGAIERQTTSANWYKTQTFPFTNQEFTHYATHSSSIGGTGATAAAEEDNAIFSGTNF